MSTAMIEIAIRPASNPPGSPGRHLINKKSKGGVRVSSAARFAGMLGKWNVAAAFAPLVPPPPPLGA